MADLLGLSARIIDGGVLDEPSNRVTQELSEVADGIAVIGAVMSAPDAGEATYALLAALRNASDNG